jgi:hypothetical protein
VYPPAGVTARYYVSARVNVVARADGGEEWRSVSVHKINSGELTLAPIDIKYLHASWLEHRAHHKGSRLLRIERRFKSTQPPPSVVIMSRSRSFHILLVG